MGILTHSGPTIKSQSQGHNSQKEWNQSVKNLSNFFSSRCHIYQTRTHKISKMTKTMIPLHLLLSITITISASSSAYPCVIPTDCSSVSTGDEKLVPVRREVYGDGRIFDISHRYTTDMPSWGSKDGLGQFLWLPASMKNGSLANNSEIKLPTHTGTHVDSPGHMIDRYFDAGFDVDTLDLEVLNGNTFLLIIIIDKILVCINV